MCHGATRLAEVGAKVSLPSSEAPLFGATHYAARMLPAAGVGWRPSLAMAAWGPCTCLLGWLTG
jgi:hypothetical protein